MITTNGVSSAVLTFVATHAGSFINGAFAVAAAGGVVWDNWAGRRDSTDNINSKIQNVETRVQGLEGKMQGLEGKIDALSEDVKEVKSMVLETGHHVMTALDGNKKPMREWLQELERRKQFDQELERRKQSDDEDCSVRPKA